MLIERSFSINELPNIFITNNLISKIFSFLTRAWKSAEEFSQ
jgi:hypothetical protein